jgi:hypothetical protein
MQWSMLGAGYCAQFTAHLGIQGCSNSSYAQRPAHNLLNDTFFPFR